MSKKIFLNEIAEFDVSDYLRDDEDIAEYLTQVLAEGDSNELLRAIGYIAKARGMTQLAKETGLGRESLYKSFRAGSKPQFETVFKVLHGLNINLKAIPKEVGT
ncbi:putative addiction module antidote protein [Nitrosomonas sp. HPC101]|uniref:addiction module antidote protein n=1 Tax=Nitrosomonas sp. HPC101 TaxID=1658667 RepID=UPI00136C0F74|nr:addiction module antidote protein [Nitrosomonas sp. HPC101]MXS86094.1 putative addiction module antidote protein [Nitrosomonas sp. HPC101]